MIIKSRTSRYLTYFLNQLLLLHYQNICGPVMQDHVSSNSPSGINGTTIDREKKPTTVTPRRRCIARASTGGREPRKPCKRRKDRSDAERLEEAKEREQQQKNPSATQPNRRKTRGTHAAGTSEQEHDSQTERPGYNTSMSSLQKRHADASDEEPPVKKRRFQSPVARPLTPEHPESPPLKTNFQQHGNESNVLKDGK
ncbi:hypothetical protein LZ30DRAFT_293870 [Colletotrichum cereale]|nr:hypothetical protein LZ30DRAFT_293870 [Colletotrichum cereale]